MDLLLLLLYAGFCTAVFKIFRIPLNKYTVPTAILGGFIFLGTLLFWMNYKHPYAKYAKEAYVSIPMIPNVSGVVTEIPVLPNVVVEEGTILYQIDKQPFENEVSRLEAKLADAKQAVIEADEMVVEARERLKEAEAVEARLKLASERVENAGAGAVSQQEIDNRLQQWKAAQADVRQVQAQLRQVELSASSEIGGVDTTVAQVEAELATAHFNLKHTTVRAPTRGLVTQLALREGTVVKSLPLRPPLVFVPTERRRIIASFWQNSMRSLKAGCEAEVILDSVPGHIFTGKVSLVSPVIPEADYQFGGELLAGDFIKHHDRMLVAIELDENLDDYGLPTGI
ncbi:MAG: HlyD family secretion protein, partial [Verrucomicrobiales bacterium]